MYEEWITPPEAATIAASFRQSANAVRALAVKARVLEAEMDAEWAGGAQADFMARYEGYPAKLNTLAEKLEAHAYQIERMKVRRFKGLDGYFYVNLDVDLEWDNGPSLDVDLDIGGDLDFHPF